ncbi:hypothetical protein [Flavobacterium fluviatile]|uniref:hypothetical protein n=1 Tax=Flavobacterium fluviatile TaxID=1862387 RepID=UPI0013D694F9|nr:hypothetical protein [Flavobacterium fluviatile]
MIEKVANNKYNTEKLNLNRTEDILEKVNYYRTLLGKTHDLSNEDFVKLQNDIHTFFNIKPGSYRKDPPQRIVRISINNQILKDSELSYLTDISQLLAPPVDLCNYGRCNLPKHQVLYCGINEAEAYWEMKPKKGDVITLSHFKLKEGATINCNLIQKDKTLNPIFENQLQEIFHILEDFFVDVFSLEVSRDRPRDYLFSAELSSQFLFYPVPSKDNIEAIIYPSVQKKKFGHNIAILNSIVLEKYDLIGVETRFILDEYQNTDPETYDLTTDNVIASFGTESFDFEKGKILYDPVVDEIFHFLRKLQTLPSGQQRLSKDNITFNLTLGKCTVKSFIKKDKL